MENYSIKLANLRSGDNKENKEGILYVNWQVTLYGILRIALIDKVMKI